MGNDVLTVSLFFIIIFFFPLFIQGMSAEPEWRGSTTVFYCHPVCNNMKLNSLLLLPLPVQVPSWDARRLRSVCTTTPAGRKSAPTAAASSHATATRTSGCTASPRGRTSPAPWRSSSKDAGWTTSTATTGMQGVTKTQIMSRKPKGCRVRTEKMGAVVTDNHRPLKSVWYYNVLKPDIQFFRFLRASCPKLEVHSASKKFNQTQLDFISLHK